MKKIFICLFVLSLAGILASTSCSITMPYDLWEEDSGFQIRMQIEPDSAEVFVNGRFIGEAYEFSTWNSALHLASRDNEIVLKGEGFVEEVIDLREYSSHRITVKVALLRDKGYVPTAKAAAQKPATATEEEQERKAYEAKTEPVKALPAETAEPSTAVGLTAISLEVAPEEAAIFIDGKFWGLSPQDGKIENLKLKPGRYQFEVYKPGYQLFKQEIAVSKQEKQSIKITLAKQS